jgi:hypothetical protein
MVYQNQINQDNFFIFASEFTRRDAWNFIQWEECHIPPRACLNIIKRGKVRVAQLGEFVLLFCRHPAVQSLFGFASL